MGFFQKSAVLLISLMSAAAPLVPCTTPPPSSPVEHATLSSQTLSVLLTSFGDGRLQTRGTHTARSWRIWTWRLTQRLPHNAQARLLSQALEQPFWFIMTDKSGSLADGDIPSKTVDLITLWKQHTPQGFFSIATSSSRERSAPKLRALPEWIRNTILMYSAGGGVLHRGMEPDPLLRPIFPAGLMQRIVDQIEQIMTRYPTDAVEFMPIQATNEPAQVKFRLTPGNPHTAEIARSLLRRLTRISGGTPLDINIEWLDRTIPVLLTVVQKTKRDALVDAWQRAAAELNVSIPELARHSLGFGNDWNDLSFLNEIARRGGIAIWLGDRRTAPKALHRNALVVGNGPDGFQEVMRAHARWLARAS